MIKVFAKKAEVVSLPAPVHVPDFDKARSLIDISIEKLNSRAGYLKNTIERDSAELFETNRTLEALLEAKAKVAPDLDETMHCTLLAELGEFSEAAE